MSPQLIDALDRAVDRLEEAGHPAAMAARGYWGRSGLVRLAIEHAVPLLLDGARDGWDYAEPEQDAPPDAPWAQDLRDWVADPETRAGFTTDRALNRLGWDGDATERKAQEMEVASVLTSLGYVKRRNRRGGVRAWRWYPRS
jgi:hypothetical protein